MFMLLLQDSLNVHRYLDLPKIYNEAREVINLADHEKDLSRWSDNHGINMEHTLPDFQEYQTKRRSRSSSKNTHEHSEEALKKMSDVNTADTTEGNKPTNQTSVGPTSMFTDTQTPTIVVSNAQHIAKGK